MIYESHFAKRIKRNLEFMMFPKKFGHIILWKIKFVGSEGIMGSTKAVC